MRRANARSSTKMDSLKPQFRTSATNKSNFSRISPKQISKGHILIFFIAAISILVFVIAKVARNSSNVKLLYGILIDGGSTGTRIHVFKVKLGSGGSPIFDFGKEGLASFRVNPGLSSFAENPVGAGGSLKELLKFGKENVPKESWGETEIRLMATAGLRLLDLGDQERILESCRSVLRSSGFKFQDEWASVVTGSEEGIYAWVAANYAHGTLGSDPLETIGIIELGGASVQVTFVSSEPLPPEFAHSLNVGKFTYNLYSHSLLHLGQDVAHESLRELLITRDQKLSSKPVQDELYVDPCTPKGYSHSSGSWNLPPDSLIEKNKYLPTLSAGGNFSECRSAALVLLQKGKEKCSYQHCHIGNTFIPQLRGKLLATENFFYTSKFFGLSDSSKSYLSDLMLAGQKYCGEDWSKLQKIYHALDEEDLLRYCFSSAYSVALLHDSLGIALDDERIGFANEVRGLPLDWALGAFILQNMVGSGVEHPHWFATIVSDDPMTRLITLALILPVATASVKRTFSAMKIVKNRLRNRMGDQWMTDSLITYVEKDIFNGIDDEVIMQHYRNMKTRRELLPKSTAHLH